MKKAVIIMFFLILILTGVVVVIYYFYEVPSRENGEYTNVSISAVYNRERIRTGFEIDGILYGNTSEYYELVELAPNQSVIIKNKNIEEQNFYEDEHTIYIGYENQRVDLELDKPQNVDYNKIEEDRNITLTLYSENFKNINFCLKWSLNYIFVKAEDYQEVEKFENYTSWDRCYLGNFSLVESNQKITISYQIIDVPDENDYINLSLIDKAGNEKIVKIK